MDSSCRIRRSKVQFRSLLRVASTLTRRQNQCTMDMQRQLACQLEVQTAMTILKSQLRFQCGQSVRCSVLKAQTWSTFVVGLAQKSL